MKVRAALLLVRVSAVLLLGLGIGGTAYARHHSSKGGGGHSARALEEGRHHLKKANALAGANKCAAAVKEYSAAYAKLGDPVVLFNRADCYRRLGQNEQAVADYREFLKGFPKASNRADIEARIASLEKPAGRHVAAAPAKEPSQKEPPKKEAPKAEERPETVARAPVKPAVVAPPPEQAVAPELLAASEPAAAESPSLLGSGGEPVIVARPDKPKKRGYWWVWVLAGAVVAGGGAAAFVVLRPHPATIPSTELGNYHF